MHILGAYWHIHTNYKVSMFITVARRATQVMLMPLPMPQYNDDNTQQTKHDCIRPLNQKIGPYGPELI